MFPAPSVRTARLATGEASRETHTSRSTDWMTHPNLAARMRDIQDPEDEQPKRDMSVLPDVTVSPLRLAPKGSMATDFTEETHPVERPAWQSLVLCLQLHYPDVAEDVNPAHNLGHLSHPRVVLTNEGIDALNWMIDNWYGREVEILTTEVCHVPPGPDGDIPGAIYHTPYRPVTGLRVIVTRTQQWEIGEATVQVLAEKERWSWMTGIKAVERAWMLYATRMSGQTGRHVVPGVARHGIGPTFSRKRSKTSRLSRWMRT